MTQKQQILKYLQDGNILTCEIAINIFECKSPRKIISRLRADNYNILSETIQLKNGHIFTKYFIPKVYSNNKKK